MKVLVHVAIATLLAVPSLAAAPKSATFVGVITDSMCVTDHEAMKAGPDDTCIRACVGDGSTFKYALTDGSRTYLLSDQLTPEGLAGKKVKVTGVLYTKTNIIKVERIVPVR